MGLIVRTIKKSDMQDIVEILKASKEDFLYGFLFFAENYDEEALWWRYGGTRQFPTLVAEYEGKVVGFATYYEHWSEDDNLYIELLLTHPKYRGRGIGSALIRKLFDVAVEKSYSVLSLHTWGTNPAYRLYKRRGFCHVGGTFYYMVNFLPQLFRNHYIRERFKLPHKIIDSLDGPPEHTNVNGHRAWRYLIDLGNDQKAEITFDEATRSLLSLNLGALRVALEPPEYKEYLDEDEIEVMISASQTLPVTHGEEAWVVGKNEPLKIKLKAKKKMIFKVANLKFGFKVRARPAIDLQVLEKLVLGDNGYVKMLVTNNTKQAFRGELSVVPKDRLLSSMDNKIEISPGSSRIINFVVKGREPVTVSLAKSKKTILFDTDILGVREEEFVSSYWYFSDEVVHTRVHPQLGFYYELNVMGIAPDLEVKRDKFYYECDEFVLEVTPRQVGQELRVVMSVMAKKDLKDYVLLRLWIRHTIDIRDKMLVPISNNKAVEIPINPSFPRWYSAVRISGIPSWIGIRSGNSVLVLSYPKEMALTVASSNSIVLSKYLELRMGERKTFTFVFSLRNIDNIAKFYGLVEPVQLSITDDNKVELSSNWFSKIRVTFLSDGNINSKIISLDPSRHTYITLKPFEGEKTLKVRYYGLTRKYMIFGVDKSHWKNKRYASDNWLVELSAIGGCVANYSIENNNVLLWLEKPMFHGLTINPTRGGWIMILKINNKYHDLGSNSWSHIEPNIYVAIEDKVTIRREWFVVPEGGVAERVILSNEDKYSKEISLSEYIFLRNPIDEVYSEKVSISEKTFWFESSRSLKVKTRNLRLYLVTPPKQSFAYRESLFSEKPLKEKPAIGVNTRLKLMPYEKVRLWRILTHKKKLALQIKKVDLMVAW